MINWWTILIGAVGIFIGYKLHDYSTRQSEKRIIDTLTAEIESLKAKQQKGRLTSEEQIRIEALQEALNILQEK